MAESDLGTGGCGESEKESWAWGGTSEALGPVRKGGFLRSEWDDKADPAPEGCLAKAEREFVGAADVEGLEGDVRGDNGGRLEGIGAERRRGRDDVIFCDEGDVENGA